MPGTGRSSARPDDLLENCVHLGLPCLTPEWREPCPSYAQEGMDLLALKHVERRLLSEYEVRYDDLDAWKRLAKRRLASVARITPGTLENRQAQKAKSGRAVSV